MSKLSQRELKELVLKLEHFIVAQTSNDEIAVLDHMGYRFYFHRFKDPREEGMVHQVNVRTVDPPRAKLFCERIGKDFEITCQSHRACRKILDEMNRYWVLYELARV